MRVEIVVVREIKLVMSEKEVGHLKRSLQNRCLEAESEEDIKTRYLFLEALSDIPLTQKENV
jgi:hypothetical protein